MKNPFLSFFFRGGKVIPIAGAKEDSVLMDKAFDKISQTLAEGEIICIFPEGKITYDGEISSFRPGIEKIITRNPVPVIPMGLKGLWGSFFSRKYGPAGTNYKILIQRFWSKVDLIIEQPEAPHLATAQLLEEKVRRLVSEKDN